MDEIEEKYKHNHIVNIRYQRWMNDNKQNTLWRIDGSNPIPEDFIVIKNGKAIEQRYMDALIGEKAERINIYSKDGNDHILSDIYTESMRTISVSDYIKEDGYHKPHFGEMVYDIYDYSVLIGGLPFEVHPNVLKFENGAQYDVIQYAGKELLLYIFPNVSLIGMYKTDELKAMNLEKVQMIN